MLDDLHFLIMRCFNNSNRAVIQRTSRISLLPGQSKILECLMEHNGISPKEIGGLCVVDKSTITSLLNKMEHQGLIFRKNDPNDKRAIQIWLTEKGADYAQRASLLCAEVDSLAVKNLSDDQQQQLRELLRIVISTFENEKQEL